MITVILSVLGLIVGAAVAEEEGLIIGLFLGLAFGMIISLKNRVLELEQALAKLKKPATTTTPEESISRPNERPDTLAQQVKAVTAGLNSDEPESGRDSDYADVMAAFQDKDTTHSEPVKPATSRPKQVNREPDLAEKVFFTIKNFFTTGNVVVKVGAIVLFFGVAFLLKYAAERSLFPIELRLFAVMAVGVALLVTGWRLRDEKLEYGLILQGAGVGLLYLTVFAASKFYHVLPVGVTFAVMLGLVALAGVLSVKQDAKSLAIFGAIGGFLAPILMSTGGGSHIVLFSYYALLNIGILGIAWFKLWRVLNLIGFAFTFIISAAWGHKAYLPQHFVSTEFFLIVFFLFYLTIAILFALKQSLKSNVYVDGTIVFGLPLIAFALQGELVKQFEYGDAITAIVLAVLYLSLAKRFWLPEQKGVRLLAESFLALGITFASLAVPLFLDGRWTAAVWSLEGAALVWVGLRQFHVISRGFGLLLSVGAGLAFITSNHHHLIDSMPILNSSFIGMALVSLSALLIAYLYEKNQQRCYQFELALPTVMVVWGLFWWFVAGVTEIEHFISNRFSYQEHSILLFIALTTFTQVVLSHKLLWSKISISFILVTPIVLLTLLISFMDYNHSHSNGGPLASLGYLAWPVALFVHFLVLRRKEQAWDKTLLTIWHASSVVMIAWLATWAISAWFNDIDDLASVWKRCVNALVLVAVAEVLLRHGKSIRWPITKFKAAYYSWGLLPVMLVLLVWQSIAIHLDGTPAPFNYIPILNPLDITQALVFSVIAAWLWFINRADETRLIPMSSTVIYGVAGLMGFAWLNTVIARSVHAFSGVVYDGSALMNSTVYQATTSIVWSLIAVILMAIASKKATRVFWFAGAGLLALVVLKLFFVDLAESDSISRIISFLVVGGLMLAIGYLSPLPPKKEALTR